MARTAITITELTAESATAVVLASVGGALDPTNGHVITPTGDIDPRELFLWVTHTTASEKDVTVKAGDNPPAVRTGAGDLVEAFAAGDSTPVNKIIPLTSSRFTQDDGTIIIDVEAAMTGRIACFRAPRSE